MKAIGCIETSSVAKGIETADAMLKASDVDLLQSSPVCPGKYLILVSGSVSSVKSSVDTGKLVSKDTLVDFFIIPNIHPDVFPAITATTEINELKAIGIIETFSLAGSVVAGDQAVKAADIELLEIRLGRALGGKSFVIFTGEVAAVKVAIDAATKEIEDSGLLLGSSIIPSPHPDILDSLL